MKKEYYLNLINDLEKKIPRSSNGELARTRWIADYLSLLKFLRSQLGEIDSFVFDEMQKKPTTSLFSGSKTEKEDYAWDEHIRKNCKNSMLLLRDWIERTFKYYSTAVTEATNVPSKGENFETSKDNSSLSNNKSGCPSKEAIILDHLIVLEEGNIKGLWIKEEKNNWIFQKLSPLAVRIIRHLYDICTYPNNAKGLTELKNANISKTTGAISTEIKNIRELCEKIGCKQIIVSTSESKHQLNPNLSFCKSLNPIH